MKLEAYKGKVVIDPTSITVPELKRTLHEIRDLLSDDDIYDRLCIFIFLHCDLSNDNPLVDRPFNTKREEALHVAFGDRLDEFIAIKDSNEQIRDKVNKCIDIYLREVNTDEQKDIHTYSKKMDQFRVMLHDMKPVIQKNIHETSGMVSYSTNMDIINSVLGDIVKLIQAKASMIALHTTGTLPKHLRGGLSPLATGDIEVVSEPDTIITEEDVDEFNN